MAASPSSAHSKMKASPHLTALAASAPGSSLGSQSGQFPSPSQLRASELLPRPGRLCAAVRGGPRGRTGHRPPLEAPTPPRSHRPEPGRPAPPDGSPLTSRAEGLTARLELLGSAFPPGYFCSRRLQAGHSLRCCGFHAALRRGACCRRPGTDDDSSWAFPAVRRRDTEAAGGSLRLTPGDLSGQDRRGPGQPCPRWGASPARPSAVSGRVLALPGTCTKAVSGLGAAGAVPDTPKQLLRDDRVSSAFWLNAFF